MGEKLCLLKSSVLYTNECSVNAVDVADDYIYLACGDSGVEIINNNGEFISSIETAGAAQDIVLKDGYIRVVHQVKNSIGPSGGSFKFEIRPESGFKWLGCDPASERKNLSEKKDEPLVFNTKMERAAYLIREMLADKDMKSVDIYEALSEKGSGHKMAENTKKEIGVRCYRKMRSWYWSLKPEEEET